MKKKVLIFEVGIIVILVGLVCCYRVSITSEIFKEKFENYKHYIDKYRINNREFVIYCVVGIYDPNNNSSYYEISILNNTDNVKNVKKIKITFINKTTKEKKVLEYPFETEISPNRYINYTYEYTGDLHEKKYYKVKYELS